MNRSEVLLIDVRGPGHHDRAEAAARLLPALAGLGSVVVHSTLRPRLAADVEALLDAGADGVVLDGPASTGTFHAGATAAMSVAAEVVVRLIADTGRCRADIVDGSDELRASASAAIAAAGLDG